MISPGRAFSLSKSRALAKDSSGLESQPRVAPGATPITPARLEVQDLGLTSLGPMGLGPMDLGPMDLGPMDLGPVGLGI